MNIIAPMAFKPDITVAAVAQLEDRFLIVEERISGQLVFNQPAGHVEEGETLLEAVVRETREETAWRFTPAHLLGVYHWRHPRTSRSTLRFAFIGTVSDHDAAQPLDRGIVRTHWLTRAELEARESRLRSPLVLRCVEDFLAGRRVPLDTIQHLSLATAAAVRAVSV